MKSKYFFMFLIVMLMSVSLIPLVNALEFDNVKQVPIDFDKYEDTITIKNSFLFIFPFGKVADIKLLENTEQALLKGSMKYQVNLYEDYNNPITGITSVDRTGNNNLVNGNWYYWDESETTRQVNTYEIVCKDGKELKNKSFESNCEQVVKGKRTEIINTSRWLLYDGGSFKAGDYTFEYRGLKNSITDVDVIPHLFGVKLNEYAWWNSDWRRKKNITITENNNTELANYSIYINVTYDSDMNTDFSDLRFTDTNDTAELSYYIENYSTGINATVWVKMLTNISASGTKNISMYYKNVGASTTSSFNNAFIFADDFETDTSANWNYTNCDEGFVISDGRMNITETSGGAGHQCTVSPKDPYQYITRNYEVTSKASADSTCTYIMTSSGYLAQNRTYPYISAQLLAGAASTQFFNLEKTFDNDVSYDINKSVSAQAFTTSTNYTISLQLLDDYLKAIKEVSPTPAPGNVRMDLVNSSTAYPSSGVYGMAAFEGCSESHTTMVYQYRVRPLVRIEPTYILGSEESFVYSENNQTYNNITFEGSTEDFTLNITTTTENPLSSSIFYYNNTEYTTTAITYGDDILLNSSVVVPSVNANTTANFSWGLTFLDGSSYNTTEIIQNITNWDIDDCSTEGTAILNLSLKDEANNTFINSTLGTTIEIDLELSNKGILWTYNKTWSNENNVSVCISDGVLDDNNYTIDFSINYHATDYVWEFYHLRNGILANNTEYFNSITNKTIVLRDLLLTDSTSFLVLYKDETSLPVRNAIIHVYRKYIGEGVFKEIENGLTNNDGETIVHLVEEDVIYRFVVTLDGTIVFTSGEYRVYCVTGEECRINLDASEDVSDFPSDWVFPSGTYSLTSNQTSRNVLLRFNTNSTATMNLTIYDYSNNASQMSTIVGSNSTTSTLGTVTINVPLSYGNKTYYATIYKGDEFVGSHWVPLKEGARNYFDNWVVFLVGMIVLSLGLVAISSGIGVIIFALLGLFIANVLQILEIPYSISIYILIAGIILIVKLLNRRAR